MYLGTLTIKPLGPLWGASTSVALDIWLLCFQHLGHGGQLPFGQMIDNKGAF